MYLCTEYILCYTSSLCLSRLPPREKLADLTGAELRARLEELQAAQAAIQAEFQAAQVAIQAELLRRLEERQLVQDTPAFSEQIQQK